MKKTVVIDVVALSSRLIGKHTPFLAQWASEGKTASIDPIIPAVTCSSQSTYLTGQWPSEHGVVGNGWYFQDECEIKFWRQSNRLVQASKVWEEARKSDPDFTCANMFWWYNMYSSVDYAVTPRPLYPADGRKLPDIHSQPMDLRGRLQKELGQFPLFNFWGPNANIKSTRWIADASMLVDQWHDPTLTLIYLPHMDYELQRSGVDFAKIGLLLEEVDEVCKDLITYYEGKGAEVIVLSEYGITDVKRPVHLNRILREHGYISVKDELGSETLDAGTCGAFAVCDHQVAHIHVSKKEDLPKVKKLMEETAGVELVLDEAGKKEYHIDHERAGDLVLVADKNSWFAYYYWLDDDKAPDYARTVDIHRKPGYDPVEMFIDPKLPVPMAKAGMILLKKKLGFRYLMDLTPLDASLIKGSHGRIDEDPANHPVFITRKKEMVPTDALEPTAVYGQILSHLNR